MTDILYKKGEKVVIRDYRAEGERRPLLWAGNGGMDHYMGKTITLEHDIYDYSHRFKYDRWTFCVSDIKGRPCIIKLPDELFIVK